MSEKMRKDATAEMTSEVGLWRGEVFSQAKRNGFSSRENGVHKSLWLEDTPEDSTKGEGPVTGAWNPWGQEEEVPLHVQICSLGFVLGRAATGSS